MNLRNLSDDANYARDLIFESILKLDPSYMAKDDLVMFTIELGFLVIFYSFISNISKT